MLQTIDLATGDGLDAAVAAQCQAEAVPDRADDVRAPRGGRARLRRRAGGGGAPHWREVYACTPVGDRLLEGYVDLLYRGADGLVVVDHKTAATTDPAELDRRVRGYRLQGAAYALAVGPGHRASRSSGSRSCSSPPPGPIERDLPDLAAAMAEVERLVRAGAELVAD